MTQTAMRLDALEFRHVLGRFPTGVVAITGLTADGVPKGLTVGSFTSVSLDPLLVGFLVGASSTSWPPIQETGRFCVNVLALDQQDLCRAFASTASDKFQVAGWRPSKLGLPILDGVLAWIECETYADHTFGDHSFVVGAALDMHIERDDKPLIFFRGGYGRFEELGGDTPIRLTPFEVDHEP